MADRKIMMSITQKILSKRCTYRNYQIIHFLKNIFILILFCAIFPILPPCLLFEVYIFFNNDVEWIWMLPVFAAAVSIPLYFLAMKYFSSLICNKCKIVESDKEGIFCRFCGEGLQDCVW